MPRRTLYEATSPAQQRATLTNNCLRTIAALERAFKMAGHYDFEKRCQALRDEFNLKLKGTPTK